MLLFIYLHVNGAIFQFKKKMMIYVHDTMLTTWQNNTNIQQNKT